MWLQFYVVHETQGYYGLITIASVLFSFNNKYWFVVMSWLMYPSLLITHHYSLSVTEKNVWQTCHHRFFTLLQQTIHHKCKIKCPSFMELLEAVAIVQMYLGYKINRADTITKWNIEFNNKSLFPKYSDTHFQYVLKTQATCYQINN